MANFNTHLNVAIIASGGLLIFGLTKNMISIIDAPILFAVGVIGGLLPDIDLPSSRPAKIGFSITSLATALLAVWFICGRRIFAIEAIIIFAISYLTMRYLIIGIFNRLTTHRGIVHSIPFVLFCALTLTHLLIYAGLKKNAYLSGIFLFVGGITHLCLDEIYSVNAFGLKLKKSFGSALKFIEFKKLPLYAFLYLLCAILWFLLPYKTQIQHIIMQTI